MALNEYRRKEYLDCLKSIQHGCKAMEKPFSKDIVKKTFEMRNIRVEFIKSNDSSSYDLWISDTQYDFFSYLITVSLD